MRVSSAFLVATVFLAVMCPILPAAESVDDVRPVGVAWTDITPAYPVRLSGYGGRRLESEGVAQRLWAKALAIGGDADGPAVLVTVDNCGIPDAMRAEVAERLLEKAGVPPERFAICFSHTHCAPCLTGALVNIFSSDVPPGHQAGIDRYSRELTSRIEEVALAALADRKPARLSWAVGSVAFARNRRGAWGGPVDHSLPVLFVTSPGGGLRAILANYACHATTLQFNQIHGDWPGTAMEAIERNHPGAVAMIAIGCGADQNPHPRGTVELALRHGEELAKEVSRLVKGRREPIRGQLVAHAKSLGLPLDTLPSREELEKLAASPSPNVSYIARKNLARLDRGETLPTELPYRVQTWSFGGDLAMVFLPGEVTVDYALRLKTEFDSSRLWVNGYANDAPCYIPSRRVLAEGGYEGAVAMVYYDRPAKFAPGIEERVIGAVHELLPDEFLANFRAETPPRSPADSLAAIKVRDGLVVELAAAEPFVMDPVAIDWDAQGRMWVLEQGDYPTGIDGNWKPGGRVKILSDTDADGRYDKAELFLEGIPFPTGVSCWRNGALVCAAPDILFAADGDGDGRAEPPQKLFTGFYTDNYNARINSLALGLDNWIHGANGLLGGKIRSEKTGVVTDISGRDVSIRPDTGELRLVSGVTQQGRARDDWDNWFGCSNSRWIFHFPLPDHYLRRNPHVPAPAPLVNLPSEEKPGELKPASRAVERFNHPESQGHITSACGLGIYRDVLLGEDLAGNAFIGETAHNLVRRYRLDPSGATFAAHRPDGEQAAEFLASEDNWMRPVQIRTGPDGALYVVDMYRAVIEHTRWIPADRAAKLDVRAGHTMGRIYRIYPRGAKLRPVRDLTKLDAAALVAALDTPNGTTRDLVHALLVQRGDPAAVEPLLGLAASAKLPAVRVQALAALDGLKAITPAAVLRALGDADARVRRHALRLAEPALSSSPDLAAASLRLAGDPDFAVRYQLALSLGGWDDARAAAALGELAAREAQDKWFRAAALSSAAQRPLDVLDKVIAAPAEGEGRAALIGGLVATAAATAAGPSDYGRLLGVLALRTGERAGGWKLAGMAQLQDALDRRRLPIASLPEAERARPLFEAARQLASDRKAAESDRESALRLLARGFNEKDKDKDLELLAEFLKPAAGDRLQKAGLAVLARTASPKAAEWMLAGWSQRAPSLRAGIVTTLLAREEWALQLLQAVAQGAVGAAEIPAAARQALARHANADIRRRSGEVFPPTGGQRAKVLEGYQAVQELRGDAVRGATVFKAACMTCHSYIGQGFALGPDLKAFYNKSVADFLAAILDPNAAVEPRYAGYTVMTGDGRALTGIVASETATNLEVVMPGGLRESILRTDVREIRATGLSLMPEGLEQAIAPQDMADLIAYLKSGG